MDIKSILQKHKNKTVSPILDWELLVAMIQKSIDEIIGSKDREASEKITEIINKFSKELGSLSDEMKVHANEVIKLHIEKRAIEIVGADGYTPKKNVDYFDGKDGKSIRGEKGGPGLNGKDAVIDYEKINKDVVKKIGDVKDTPNQLVDKVNIAKEKILISSVKNLQDELDKLRSYVRETAKVKGSPQSGGGMGNWVHQAFNISSATTTITLSSKVAANGTAHIYRYQGQVLSLNVQYSVAQNGKVITLLFTPEDGTVFDATFVRT